MSNILAIAGTQPQPVIPPLTLTVDASSLNQALQLAQLLAKAKSTQSQLSRVKLTVTRDGLTLQATDTAMHSTTSVFADVVGLVENVSVCIAPDALRQALPKKGNVALTIIDEQVLVGPYRIRTEAAENFPVIDFPLTAVVTYLFAEDLRRVAFAMSKDTTRLNLCSCLLESVKGKQRLVATDGHRLAVVDTERNYKGPKLVVPRAVIDIILKLKPSGVMVGANKEKIVFTLLGYGAVVISPVVGEFPDYKVVIPRQQAGGLRLKREAWLQALNDILPVAKTNRLTLVKYEVVGSDRLQLSSENEAQAASCAVAMEPCPNAGALAGGWGLNLTYVKDVLASLTSETVQLGFNDTISQFTIAGDNEHDLRAGHVVMPARV